MRVYIDIHKHKILSGVYYMTECIPRFKDIRTIYIYIYTRVMVYLSPPPK